MGLTARAGRSWTTGNRCPENPGEVAGIVAGIAEEAGLLFSTDAHLRADEICAELPMRAALVQLLIATATRQLADHFGGVRALARAMKPAGEGDLEPTLRRWIALGVGELRPIADLNRIMARLGKFCRGEIRKRRRRIIVERGPAGDRQLVLALLQLLDGADQVQVPSPDETLTILPALVVVAFIAALADTLLSAKCPAAAA
jgi:hypothetical protein